MKIISVIAEDFVNYKKPSMYIGFPHCTFKCDKECGMKVCQNSELAKSPVKEISADALAEFYIRNQITEAVVMAGLEPLDSFDDVSDFINTLDKKHFYPDIVIYTGYTEDEVKRMGYLDELLKFKEDGFTLIIKYGRFIPIRPHVVDEILGVELASNNQYAVQY